MREFEYLGGWNNESESPWLTRIALAFLVLIIGIGLGYAWAYKAFHNNTKPEVKDESGLHGAYIAGRYTR